MTRRDATWALRALGHSAATIASLDGSMSSSGVYQVTLDGGSEAVLKVTYSEDGRQGVAASRHELDFYVTLAPTLPIRTPRLLDHFTGDDAVILLLSRHRAAEPASEWDEASWLSVARDLAALHDFPLPTEPQWRRRPWIIDSLRAPDLDLVLKFWSRPGEAELLKPILDDTESLAQAISALPPCFRHGDCHAGNLLREEGSIVWADWQAAGIGNPAGDLAFPSIRALPDGVELPQDAMLGEYAALRGLDAMEIRSAVIAEELAILLLEWPNYARFNTEVGIQRVHARVHDLVPAWNAQ